MVLQLFLEDGTMILVIPEALLQQMRHAHGTIEESFRRQQASCSLNLKDSMNKAWWRVP